MKKRLLCTLPLCLVFTAPALAQTTTATGTGVGISRSTSQAGAVAIGGGNAAGGNARANGNTINIAANPANTVSTIRQEGTSTVKNVPTAFAPSLAAAGLETCLGSVSGGGSFVGTGFSFGSTIPDPGCAARLDARTLWSMGLKKAAIARLCLRDDIVRSMPEVCAQYLPYYGAQPVAAPLAPYRSAWLTSTTTAKAEPILLIDGNSGKERLCNDYDEPGQKCRTWAYATPEEYKPRKQKVAKLKPAPLPKEITNPSPSPSPAPAAETPTAAQGF
jgi:hypothetical protein